MLPDQPPGRGAAAAGGAGRPSAAGRTTAVRARLAEDGATHPATSRRPASAEHGRA
jgi:hypothetical protein